MSTDAAITRRRDKENAKRKAERAVSGNGLSAASANALSVSGRNNTSPAWRAPAPRA